MRLLFVCYLFRSRSSSRYFNQTLCDLCKSIAVSLFALIWMMDVGSKSEGYS